LVSNLVRSEKKRRAYIHGSMRKLSTFKIIEEEILLRLREQATEYSFWTLLSIIYTFGSIYSNIVNPIF
jgi:hypothetical protein